MHNSSPLLDTCFWMCSLQWSALTRVSGDGSLTGSLMDSDNLLHASLSLMGSHSPGPIFSPKTCMADWWVDLMCATVCFWWYIPICEQTVLIQPKLSSSRYIASMAEVSPNPCCWAGLWSVPALDWQVHTRESM